MPRQKIECPDCGHQHFVQLVGYARKGRNVGDDPLEEYLSSPDDVETVAFGFAEIITTMVPDYGGWDEDWGNPIGSMLSAVSGDTERCLSILAKLFGSDDWLAKNAAVPKGYLKKYRRAVAQEDKAARDEPKPFDLEMPSSLPETAAATQWDSVVADLSLGMTQSTFNTLIKPTSATHNEEAGTLTVLVPNDIVKQWLENRLNKQVSAAISLVYGDVAVSYAVSRA